MSTNQQYTFCHPELDSGSQIADRVRNDKIETLAKTIFYNLLTMPPKLLKALDKTVDKLYRKEGFKSDTKRVAYLFELNQSLTSLVGDDEKKLKGKQNE